MPANFEINSSDVQQALAETILWCTRRQLTTSSVEYDRIQQRLKLMDEAAELMRQGMVQESQRLNPFVRIAKRRRYRQGRALLAEANSLPVSLAQRLRSPELRPEAVLVHAPAYRAMEDAVRALVPRRAALVSILEHHPMDAQGAAGRLLLYWPDENLADGAAEYASLGFFDTDNTPPWDTWVAFSNRVLLSWVPADMIALVQKGIDSNPEGCIAWLE
jgi:hypothetical protein